MKTLKLMATLRDWVGDKVLDVPFEDGRTVRDLIDAIGQVNPELKAKMVDDNGDLNGVVHILVSGRNILWLDGMDTVIEADDQVALIPPAAGG